MRHQAQLRGLSISSFARAMVVPNFFESGQSAPALFTAIRQYTFAPGAWRAIFSSSSIESKAKSGTPCAWAAAMAEGFLTVLPKLIFSAGAPAARQASISGRLAASKHDPCPTSRRRICARRICLHGIINHRRRQRARRAA